MKQCNTDIALESATVVRPADNLTIVPRAHRAAEGGERACNYIDGMVLIITKFRPYPLRVSVYYYVYPQIFRARILFLVIFSIRHLCC